ncbi:MAG: Gfo/Idh/MocA family oxidoreductase, partial [Kiritimatiellia bacterium]
VRKMPKTGSLTFAKQSSAAMQDVKCDLDDYGALLIRLGNGARGVFMTSSLCAGRKVRIDLQVYGSKESLCWNHEKSFELFVGHRDQPNEIMIESPLMQKEASRKYALLPSGHPMGYHDAICNLFGEFYCAVERNISGKKGISNYPTFADATCELKLVEAALKSARTGKWVDIR